MIFVGRGSSVERVRGLITGRGSSVERVRRGHSLELRRSSLQKTGQRGLERDLADARADGFRQGGEQLEDFLSRRFGHGEAHSDAAETDLLFDVGEVGNIGILFDIGEVGNISGRCSA